MKTKGRGSVKKNISSKVVEPQEQLLNRRQAQGGSGVAGGSGKWQGERRKDRAGKSSCKLHLLKASREVLRWSWKPKQNYNTKKILRGGNTTCWMPRPLCPLFSPFRLFATAKPQKRNFFNTQAYLESTISRHKTRKRKGNFENATPTKLCNGISLAMIERRATPPLAALSMLSKTVCLSSTVLLFLFLLLLLLLLLLWLILAAHYWNYLWIQPRPPAQGIARSLTVKRGADSCLS